MKILMGEEACHQVDRANFINPKLKIIAIYLNVTYCVYHVRFTCVGFGGQFNILRRGFTERASKYDGEFRKFFR